MSLIDELIQQPVTRRLLSSASQLRDHALRAQETTCRTLNLPTAAAMSRLEARLRSAVDRIGRLEDELDRLEGKLRERPRQQS